jgi:Zn-dependent peptidase ImmA (M78 family)
MPPRNRAVRAATSLLENLGEKKLPVRIDEIARKYSFIQYNKLPTEISGMIIPAPQDSRKRWIIVVNKDHGHERQRFSLAHELGHLVLHEYKTPHADGIRQVRFRDADSALGTNRDEIEANQFAAELLMPTSLIITELKRLGLDSWDGISSEATTKAFDELAAKCRVSQQALLLRIGNLFHRDERY